MVRLIPHLFALPLRALVVVATLPTPQACGQPLYGVAACGVASVVQRQHLAVDPMRVGAIHARQASPASRSLNFTSMGVNR